MQTVLAQTREILLAAVAFEAERRALPMQPHDGLRTATQFAETSAAALESYADDLTGRPEAVRTPTLVLAAAIAQARSANETTPKVAPLPALSDARARVVARAAILAEQISTLPHWGVALSAPAFPTEASQA